MQSIENKILSRIFGHGKGWVFSGNDFLNEFKKSNIDNALFSLVKLKKIRRVCRGIYEYPRFSNLLNQELSPDIDQVAKAFARKLNWRIQPSGDAALNLLGLSTQVQGAFIYLSDGPDHKYLIGKQTLEFKKTALKNIGYKHPESGLLVQALSALGKERVTPEVIGTIRKTFNTQQRRIVREETRTTTGWIYELIKEICSEEKE